MSSMQSIGLQLFLFYEKLPCNWGGAPRPYRSVYFISAPAAFGHYRHHQHRPSPDPKKWVLEAATPSSLRGKGPCKTNDGTSSENARENDKSLISRHKSPSWLCSSGNDNDGRLAGLNGNGSAKPIVLLIRYLHGFRNRWSLGHYRAQNGKPHHSITP